MQAHVYSCVPRHARKQYLGLKSFLENTKTTSIAFVDQTSIFADNKYL